MTTGERVLVNYAAMLAELRQRLRDQLDRLRKERPPPEE
jgi:hypothetical protein